jgi:hypothetical protein
VYFLPNVQDEPRPWLARLVLLGARDMTDVVVGSGALFGCLDYLFGPIARAISNRGCVVGVVGRSDKPTLT